MIPCHLGLKTVRPSRQLGALHAGETLGPIPIGPRDSWAHFISKRHLGQLYEKETLGPTISIRDTWVHYTNKLEMPEVLLRARAFSLTSVICLPPSLSSSLSAFCMQCCLVFTGMSDVHSYVA